MLYTDLDKFRPLLEIKVMSSSLGTYYLGQFNQFQHCRKLAYDTISKKEGMVFLTCYETQSLHLGMCSEYHTFYRCYIAQYFVQRYTHQKQLLATPLQQSLCRLNFIHYHSKCKMQWPPMAYIILMTQVQQVQVFSVAVKILKRKVWQRQLECEHLLYKS